MKIGEKIKQLRTRHGLTQEELASRCDLSKGFISQVERDLASPSIATLIDILECLGTNLQDFFNESSAEKLVFGKEDTFVKQYEERGLSIQWLVPNAQKNSMEPILLTLSPGSSTDEDMPHGGEEFGYILKGTLRLSVGAQSYRVKQGEVFYYGADKPHTLSNPGKGVCQVLWVSSPPSF